jgi:hypothetical protein
LFLKIIIFVRKLTEFFAIILLWKIIFPQHSYDAYRTGVIPAKSFIQRPQAPACIFEQQCLFVPAANFLPGAALLRVYAATLLKNRAARDAPRKQQIFTSDASQGVAAMPAGSRLQMLPLNDTATAS